MADPRPVPVTDRLVKDVGHGAVGDCVDGSIVKEGPVVPVAAFIAVTGIPKSVVYTPVEADFGRPISVVECVGPIIVCPIAGRP
jgi:hypothetical protein